MPSAWAKIPRATPEVGPAQPDLRSIRQRLGIEDSEPGIEPSFGLEDLAMLLSGAPQAAAKKAITSAPAFEVNQAADPMASILEQALPKAKIRGVYHSPTIQGEPAMELARRTQENGWPYIADRNPGGWREILQSAGVSRSGGPNKALSEYNAIGAPYYGELRHPITREPVLEGMTERMVRGLDRGDYTELVPPYTILNKTSAWRGNAMKKAARDAKAESDPIWQELAKKNARRWDYNLEALPLELDKSLYKVLMHSKGSSKINKEELNNILEDLLKPRLKRVK